jgi:uncharacterized membrane protein YjgN (DUF898 family)
MEDHMAPITEQTYRPTFTGSASEYFRIWIVNLFLTVITLGIYYAWAKVRTRRYFYTHTLLVNHPFDYLADPRALFKGYLLIVSLFLVYVIGAQIEPTLSALAMLAFYGLLPYLIYKSLRFRAHNTAYRNIRFHFHGTLQESYHIFLLWPLLLPLTLGLIFPYLAFRQRHYAFNNFAYGTTRNHFAGTVGKFYAVYIAAGLITAVAYLLFFLILFLALPQMEGSPAPLALGLLGTGYVAVFALFLLLQQYIFAELFNYTWNHSTCGQVRFQSSLQAGRLAWIRLSNVVAIVLSLGFLIPWAHVRRHRYIVENLALVTAGSLDDFTADVGAEVSAVGDAAADVFDFDIGV